MDIMSDKIRHREELESDSSEELEDSSSESAELEVITNRMKSEEEVIISEHNMWLSHVPYLYDSALTHALQWISPTVQWLPDVIPTDDSDLLSQHRLILGTHMTAGDLPDLLLVASVPVPNDGTTGEQLAEGYGGQGSVRMDIKIAHEGPVRRARYMPQNPDFIATQTMDGDVLLFDVSKHPPEPPVGSRCAPNARLVGHTVGGTGLAWSRHRMGYLLSAGYDTTVRLWNVFQHRLQYEASRVFKAHVAPVQDVQWHESNARVFGSVDGAGRLMVWDIRAGSDRTPQLEVGAHNQKCNCLAFSPHSEASLATGADDNTVKLWDLRQLQRPIHALEWHRDAVFQVQWAPHNPSIIGSSGGDRRLHIWDLTIIGAEQSEMEALEGPPELLFIHGGHTGPVMDFSWNENNDWMVGSVCEGPLLQVWKISESLYDED
jgi:histone-binding protein RBBP4